MDILRLGDRGPAVADVHAALRSLGAPRRRRHRRPAVATSIATPPDGALDTAEYDAATELAVRHFQQIRGLSVDGRVGEETYRALNEARWSRATGCCATTPSDRPAATTSSTCRTGCTSSATTPAPSTASSGRRPRPAAHLPARLRADLRRHLRPGHPAGAQASSAARSPAAARSCCGRAPRWSRRPAPHRPAHRGRPRPRRRRARYIAGETTEADLVFDLASRIEGRLAAAGATVYLTRGPRRDPGSPSEPRSPTRPGPICSSRCTWRRTARSTPVVWPATTTAPARGGVHGRRAVRQPGPPRGHRRTGMLDSGRTPRPGTSCG